MDRKGRTSNYNLIFVALLHIHLSLVDSQEVLNMSETLVQNPVPLDIPRLMVNLSEVTQKNASVIQNSKATTLTINEILQKIDNISKMVFVNETTIMDFLKTVDVLGAAEKQWEEINKNSTTKHASSDLLNAIEDFGSRISNQSFTTSTTSTYIARKNTNKSLSEDIGKDLTTHINIPNIKENTSITIIVLSAFGNILPVRNQTCKDCSLNGTRINGDVVVVQTQPKINNISLKYTVKNTTLGNPQCVFWNFDLLNNAGGWDSTGCKLIRYQNDEVTCECDHPAPFSILMSPSTVGSIALSKKIGIAAGSSGFLFCLCVGIFLFCFIKYREFRFWCCMCCIARR